MSITSGFKKYKNYKADSNGDHQLQSFWTSSDTVDGNITEASTRANLVNGETLTTSLGKIKKFFSDLGTSAFKNTTDTYSGTGTDPVTGKAVKEAIDGLDVTGASNIAASKTIKAWSETDGKVSITTQDIAISNSQISGLGTASTKDVPSSGDASSTEVVMGDDSRLTDARPASDVSAWAKASTKPTYTASEVGAIATTAKGANNGVAELDSAGKVPSSQLPSYVDDVLEYNSMSDFPTTGESGKIYIAKDTNKTYRWSGTTYVEISESLALGETSSTAYRGDRGKIAYDHSQTTSGNPHNVTKSDVGLSNVDNTSDLNKPISTATQEALDEKADSGDVTETDTPNATPFLYRETPYNADRVFLDELVGCSVAWNQLVLTAYKSFTNTTTDQRTTVKLRVQFTGTNINLVAEDIETVGTYNFVVKSTNSGTLVLKHSGQSVDIGFAYVNNVIENHVYFISIKFLGVNPSVVNGLITDNVMISDLTQAFGTSIADYAYTLEQATAGSGIAWLKSHGFFTKDYYPYNTGELISVKTSGKKVVGFNQWDEECESGYINLDTGENQSDSSKIRAKNYIRVLPNTVYYKKSPYPFWNCYYDENKNFIGYGNSPVNTTFTTPANCHYIRFAFETAYGTTYMYDTCINISKTEGTPKNGDYVPYEEKTYDISNIDLRGIPKLVNNELVYDGDTYESNGSVTRKYGIVDLGDLNWTNDSGNNRYYAALSGAKTPPNNDSVANIIAEKYIVADNNSLYNGSAVGIALATNGNLYAYRVSEAPTGELVYELATPTTETTDPYTNPQICDKDGTEEFIDNRTVPIPVGHNSTYADLPSIMDGDFLNYMAKNFASEEYVDRALEEVDTELDTKVDKVEGKGLSVNDYTNEEKALVETIPDKADADDVKSTQTVTGNLITLTDGSETYAQGLSVELEPKQDLHGYDFPWVGGAGKNKADKQLYEYNWRINNGGSWSVSGEELLITFTNASSSGVYSFDFSPLLATLNGTYTYSFEIKSSVENSKIDFGFQGGLGEIVKNISTSWTRIYSTGTFDGTNQPFVIYCGESNNPKTVYIKNFQIEAGDQATPFAPNSNICPISGYEGVDVEDVGKNLFDINASDLVLNYQLDKDTGLPTSLSQGRFSSGFMKVKPSTSYYYTNVIRNTAWWCTFYYDENKNFLSKSELANTETLIASGALTTAQNCAFVRIVGLIDYIDSVMVHEGTTATTYEPYKSRTASVIFGQTVYGGSVDVTNGGTEKKYIIKKISDLSWTYRTISGVEGYVFVSNDISGIKQGQSPVMASCYRIKTNRNYIDGDSQVAISNNTSATDCVIKDDAYTDATTFTTARGDETLLFELAEYETLTTPPTDLKLLQDTNNLTTNGTTITLDYIPNNSIGDAVKASEEYTDRAVERVDLSEYMKKGVDYVTAGQLSGSTLGTKATAEGQDTVASGTASHTEGIGTCANTEAQTVIGKYNVEDTNHEYAFIIGGGSSDSSRSNLFGIKWDGTMVLNGSTVGIAENTSF